MLNQGYFALHVYDFFKKVHIYISIQDYMAKRDLRVIGKRKKEERIWKEGIRTRQGIGELKSNQFYCKKIYSLGPIEKALVEWF